MKELQPNHPALLGKGTTIFLKQVKSSSDVKRLLQPASGNQKLGNGHTAITKGKWKGMPMYSLSLEERKTCPSTCNQWRNCYGNNMPFANRIDHKDASFLQALQAELTSLSLKHRQGFVVRLHVLGDFYSVGYVNFWKKALKEHAGLRIFGYTHRLKSSTIGRAIEGLNTKGGWIRWSDAGGPMSANTDQVVSISSTGSGVANANQVIGLQPQTGRASSAANQKTLFSTAEGIHCPEQTGKTAGCITCGLCWSTTKAIRFSVH